MHLIAMLDGERIDATKYTPDAWAVLKESEERKRMVMPLCGVRAIAKNRGPDTRWANIPDGSPHYSDRTYAKIADGEKPEDEGAEFLMRMLDRCVARPRR